MLRQPAKALAVLASAACLPVAAAPYRLNVDRFRSQVGNWQLDIAHDHFSGQVVCRLRARNRRATFRAGAVGFQLGRHTDVSNAVYRIDTNQLRTARDDRPELIELNVPVETGGIANPSDGMVWIPLRLFEQANMVTIEPRPGGRLRSFHIGGLRGLYAEARERGCVPDVRFIK